MKLKFRIKTIIDIKLKYQNKKKKLLNLKLKKCLKIMM